MKSVRHAGGPASISVCMAAYNREATIGEALDSVLAQVRPADEIVVVDDASTDRTAEKIAAYGERVRLLRRATNSGLPAIARNEAIRAATGTYVAFLDSDDTMVPERLAWQAEDLDAHPEHALCHGYVRYMDRTSQVGSIRHEGAIPASGHCAHDLLRHCFITTSAVMVRAEVFRQIGYFSETARLRVGEDYDLFMRIATAQAIGFVPRVVGHYRVSDLSITQEVSAWRQNPEDVLTHEGFLQHAAVEGDPAFRSKVRASLHDKLLTNSLHWRERGHAGRALWFARRAVALGVARPDTFVEAVKALPGLLGVRRNRSSVQSTSTTSPGAP